MTPKTVINSHQILMLNFLKEEVTEEDSVVEALAEVTN